MTPKIVLVSGTLIVAALVSVRPSMWLVGVAVLYRVARAVGAGQGIGARDMLHLDGLVFQALMVIYGVFSMFCRDVHPTAVFACGLVTALYVESRRNLERVSTRATWITVAFTWALVLWRASHPIQGPTVLERLAEMDPGWN